MKNFYLILIPCIIFLFIGCQSNEDVDSNVVIFSDSKLEEVIREEINKPEGDILKSDVEK